MGQVRRTRRKSDNTPKHAAQKKSHQSFDNLLAMAKTTCVEQLRLKENIYQYECTEKRNLSVSISGCRYDVK